MNRSPEGATQDEQYLAAAKRFAPALERLARGYEADPIRSGLSAGEL